MKQNTQAAKSFMSSGAPHPSILIAMTGQS